MEPPPKFALEAEVNASLLSAQPSSRTISEKVLRAAVKPVTDDGMISVTGDKLTVVYLGGSTTVAVVAFGQSWGALRHLRDEGEEIRFLRVNGPGRDIEDITVYRYLRDARPIGAYLIRLPGMAFNGDLAFFMDQLSISDQAVSLTLLNLDGRGPGNKTVLSEYKVRTSLGRNILKGRGR